MIEKCPSVIVIPIYKSFSDLTTEELQSLKSTCKQLGRYPHVLFGPANLDWDEYSKFYHSWDIKVDVKIFDAKYFTDVQGYNKLLKSVRFYEKFKNYKYILIFQTDAYILKDDFDLWCNKEYDYIGSPWFENWGLNKSESKIMGVGNGGFSLRNVKSTIRILKRAKWLLGIRSVWFKTHLQGLVKIENVIILFKNYFKIKNMKLLNNILLAPYVNEDYYLSQSLAGIFSDYKVAPVEDAIKFSFEVNPSLLYKMNHNQLPFGCHAWEKNEPEFWSSIIGK